MVDTGLMIVKPNTAARWAQGSGYPIGLLHDTRYQAQCSLVAQALRDAPY